MVYYQNKRLLAIKLETVVQFSILISHNKVSFCCIHISTKASKQDVSDGEFSTAKTKLSQVTKQSTEADFQEVLESKSFVQFGEKYLGIPGVRAGLTARVFSDLDPTEV